MPLSTQKRKKNTSYLGNIFSIVFFLLHSRMPRIEYGINQITEKTIPFGSVALAYRVLIIALELFSGNAIQLLDSWKFLRNGTEFHVKIKTNNTHKYSHRCIYKMVAILFCLLFRNII